MATENMERKQAAVEYLKENAIPKALENLLNNVVDICPDDLYGYMAEYFAGLAKQPSIANVTASEIFSRRGYSSFDVKIESLIHGDIQELSSFSGSIDTKPPTEFKVFGGKGKTPVPVSDSKIKMSSESDLGITNSNDVDEVHCAINSINGEIRSALKGCKLYDQREVDGVLQNIITTRAQTKVVVNQNEAKAEIDEHHATQDESVPNNEHGQDEPYVPGLPVSHVDTLAVSMAVATSASRLTKRGLYQYLYQSTHDKEPSAWCLPIPMVAVLSSGRKTPGKLYIIKDVMVFAKQDLVLDQALKQLTKIYQELEAILMQKSPSNILSETGSFTPNMDRPDQALDLIREAVQASGLAHDSDINVALRCCSSDVYDKDKQKYEISSGALKPSEELIHFYEDLCERYPEIRIIIDPFVVEDSQSRLKLQEKVGDKCFIMNTFVNQPNPENNFEKHTPGLNVRVQDSTTITQFLDQAKTIKDEGKILVISPNDLGNHEDCLVDVAVASEAHFIVLDAPVHLEQISKYNRLLTIERHFLDRNTLSRRERLVPTVFVEPIPEDETEGDEKPSEDETEAT